MLQADEVVVSSDPFIWAGEASGQVLQLREPVGGVGCAEVDLLEGARHWNLDWKPILGQAVGEVHPCVVSLLAERLVGARSWEAGGQDVVGHSGELHALMYGPVRTLRSSAHLARSAAMGALYVLSWTPSCR